MKIDEIYCFSCCIYVFKNRNLFQNNSNVHNTRRAGVIKVVFQRLSVCQRSIYFDAAKFFNQLPTEVAQVLKLGIFKRKIKELILSNQLVAHWGFFFLRICTLICQVRLWDFVLWRRNIGLLCIDRHFYIYTSCQNFVA